MRKMMLTGLLIACVVAGAVMLFHSHPQLEPGMTTPPAPTPSSTNSPTRSPLAAYLGFGHHPDAEDAVAKGDEIAHEKFMSSCMAAKGFRYWPELPRESKDGVISPDDGASARNYRFRAGLSARAQEQYAIAMDGFVPTAGQEGPDLERYDANDDGQLDVAEGAVLGCRGAAGAAHPGLGAVRSRLARQLAAMEEGIASSDAVARGREAWARCMNELGFEGNGPNEVQASQLRAIAEGRFSLHSYHVIEPCNDHVRAGFERARLDAERAFFRRYRTIIERWALRP